MKKSDLEILRTLAEPYSEIARQTIQQERIERYYRTNSLEAGRPVVLIDEIPWGEIRDEALRYQCAPEWHWLEGRLRRSLYQWTHFQADLVIPPVFYVGKKIRSTGIGLDIQETWIKGDTGSYAAAHEYKDLLKTDDELERLRPAVITYDREATELARAQAQEVFSGLLPVELSGHCLHANLWDDIARYRGVDNLLLDLAERPDFMHRTVRRFADIAAATFRQMTEQGLLDPALLLVHCTPACARELPAAGFAGVARPRDVWGRCAAQIFGSVSPAMHDEFDLAYNEKLFEDCGLVYYGCCEPMDRKIDLLRKRFKNLRKVSITPWADPERAAAQMGNDLVMAAKPNPAFVSSPHFNPKPVADEIARYLEACRRHGTPCEFVLKDVSTIANKPENLTLWLDTVNRTIDRYWA